VKLIAELKVASCIPQKKSRYFISISNIRTVLGSSIIRASKDFSSRQKQRYFCVTENSMEAPVSAL
jgi:hypothetical protein